MTNAKKLMFALELLHEVAKDWDADKVKEYPEDLPEFDELLAKMGGIWITN